MSRCATCDHAVWEGFKGYEGRWLCMHPHRDEIDNSGHFAYPKIENPQTLICKTPKNCSMIDDAAAISKAATPKWCYYKAVEKEQRRREKVGEPPFDPDRQRKILYGD